MPKIGWPGPVPLPPNSLLRCHCLRAAEHILRNFLDSTKDEGVAGLGGEVPQRGPGAEPR